MASSYPSSLDSFTTKTDKEDDYLAAHMNDVQNAVVATQTELGTDVAGSATDLKTRLAVMMADSGAVLNGSSFPVTPTAMALYYKSHEELLYVRDSADSSWAKVGETLSNQIHSWRGVDDISGNIGFYKGTSLTPTAGEEYIFYYSASTNSYETIYPTVKWTKISGVATLTFHVRCWASAANNFTIRGDCGGQTGTVAISASHTTPTWRSTFTVDVSGLSNGTTYDIKVEGQTDSAVVTSKYISGLSIMGS